MTTASASAPPPPAVAVELFSTSILSNHKVRSRHERYVSVLQVKKIPFVYHDLASDELAKKRWRRVALDAQIPGLLVHNEWRGTFEEFEEAIEFGELDLFLRIDAERARREAEEGIIPQPAQMAPTTRSASSTKATKATKPRKASKHVVKTAPALAQPRAPSMTSLAPALPMAAPREVSEGTKPQTSGDAERFMRSIGLTDLNLTEEELNEVLQAGSSDATADKSIDGSEQADRGEGKYANSLGLGTPSSKGGTTVPRTYVPSAEAGIKPLRLAKMGNGESSSRSASSTVAPHARYNASQTSSRALAAEAQASASSRAFSSAKLREAVAQGDDLKSAMSTTRLVSNADTAEQIVGREDIDDLLASLGLNDVKMTDEEAEQFLFEGAIPEGLGTDGMRLGRSDSVVDRARNETAAREVALRARQKGHGSSASLVSSKSSESARHSFDDGEAIAEESHDDVPVAAGKEKATTATSIEEKVASPVEETQSSTDTVLDKKPVAAEPISGSPEEEVAAEAEKGEAEPAPTTALEDKVADMSLAAKPEAAEPDAVTAAKEEVPSTTTSEAIELTASAKQDDATAGQSTPKQTAIAVLASTPASPPQQVIESPLTSKRSSSSNVTEPVGAAADSQGAVTPTKGAPTQINDLSEIPEVPTKSQPAAQSTVDIQGSMSTSRTSPSRVDSNLPPLELDSSFNDVASLIQADAKDDMMVNSQLASSPHLPPNSAPAVGGSFHEVQRDTVQHLSPPMSAPPATNEGGRQIAERRTMSPGESHSSPTPRVPNRRRGLDVQRKSVGSNASDRALSPDSSTRSVSGMQMPGRSYNGTPSPRSASRPLETTAAYSPESQRSLKSPKSKLFSIGRRKSKDKRGGKAEEDDEDIPTTTDPTLVESRADYATRGGRPMDRSQKTLSVILREADEALAGDDDDGYGDADVVGSFDFELDDDGIDVER